ncbi:MAG: zf-TFIIB domain-containing protein [Actinomycetota bacterium]
MECPVCTDVTLAVSSREGVEIDYCPQCRGVWLDRGELDKVIDRVVGARPDPATTEPQTPQRDRRYDQRMDSPRQDRYDLQDRPPRQDRYDDREYDRRRRKKKMSFLEDLFDFD